ncbi:hypothetical protein OEA41_004667 [Lepraria neglecta]|uniref:SnoaL-like domain-containing protein n=1 Tax=Lepraria neglecta TaxID=209136 RepID=A0AAE0DFZ3_9LECA|nr:hypothetical protein OEA41_004667 [Lepraria neglecta]
MRLPIILATLATLATLPSLLASPFPLKSFSHRLETRSNTTKSYCPGHPAPEGYQRELFFAFINDLYVKKDVIGAFDTYIAENLIEHDPFDAQGRAANAAKLANIIPYVPSTVLRMSFDNNVGLAHVRVNQANKEPIALADIYRMDGTCIVEHWDVTQSRPANATNPIAMF